MEDEHEFLAEEQPILPVDLPTVESPGYVTESDPEEDREEYEDDETEDGSVDYPMDDGDDDDGDSSGDDADEDEDDEDEDEEDEEEEEHLAPADSTIVIPIDELVFPPEGTELVIPPPSTDITIGARISRIRPLGLPHSPFHQWAREERLARCTAPPAHPSPPPVPSPLLPSSGYCRITITFTTPLPPSLYIPSTVDCRDDIPESEQPPCHEVVFVYSRLPDMRLEEEIREVGYGIRILGFRSADGLVPEIAT
ncbi:hypothetical protein Tco_0610398 [Tanacetum coccineum]